MEFVARSLNVMLDESVGELGVNLARLSESAIERGAALRSVLGLDDR